MSDASNQAKVSLTHLHTALMRFADEPVITKRSLLGEQLAEAFALYIAQVKTELRWDSETFSALAANVENILREHAPLPPAPKDVDL